jgi:hypothetical protein
VSALPPTEPNLNHIKGCAEHFERRPGSPPIFRLFGLGNVLTWNRRRECPICYEIVKARYYGWRAAREWYLFRHTCVRYGIRVIPWRKIERGVPLVTARLVDGVWIPE